MLNNIINGYDTKWRLQYATWRSNNMLDEILDLMVTAELITVHPETAKHRPEQLPVDHFRITERGIKTAKLLVDLMDLMPKK